MSLEKKPRSNWGKLKWMRSRRWQVWRRNAAVWFICSQSSLHVRPAFLFGAARQGSGRERQKVKEKRNRRRKMIFESVKRNNRKDAEAARKLMNNEWKRSGERVLKWAVKVQTSRSMSRAGRCQKWLKSDGTKMEDGRPVWWTKRSSASISKWKRENRAGSR